MTSQNLRARPILSLHFPFLSRNSKRTRKDGQTFESIDLNSFKEIFEIEDKVAAYSPVPGGVGPMTVTMLLANTVDRWQKHCGLPLTISHLLP